MDTIRKTLMESGFIHVTGLPTTTFFGGSGYTIGSPHLTRNWGRHDYQNSFQVVVTPIGEVWLRTSSTDHLPDNVASIVAPNGRGAMVPCANGEKIHPDYLDARTIDPDWKGKSGEFGW